jgi:uncharacterized protein (TIGR02145 family)
MRTKLTKIALAATFGLALAFTLSCSSDDSGGDSPGDPSSSSGGGGTGGDIANYRTVEIGIQVWMAENLNHDVAGSKCYSNSSANCAKYGRLYNWTAAMAACPSGWHLPSNADWNALRAAVGGFSTMGTKLKAANGWNENGNGTDNYEFSALPGGIGNSEGGFFRVGDEGWWWSSDDSSDRAYYRMMGYDFESVDENLGDKSDLFSVRCIKN